MYRKNEILFRVGAWWVGLLVLVLIEIALGTTGLPCFIAGGAYGLLTGVLGYYAFPFLYRL